VCLLGGAELAESVELPARLRVDLPIGVAEGSVLIVKGVMGVHGLEGAFLDDDPGD